MCKDRRRADCYVLLHLHCLWMTGNVQQWVLSAQAVGGLVQPCQPHSCSTATVTHFTPCLNSVSASQVFTPLGLYHVEPEWLSDQWSKYKLADKAAGSPNRIHPLDCFNVRPVSEPTELMCNVSLHRCAIGGLPSPHLLPPTYLAWLFSLFHIGAPETPHAPAWSDFSLSISGVQHTAKKKYHQWGGFHTNRCPEKSLT